VVSTHSEGLLVNSPRSRCRQLDLELDVSRSMSLLRSSGEVTDVTVRIYEAAANSVGLPVTITDALLRSRPRTRWRRRERDLYEWARLLRSAANSLASAPRCKPALLYPAFAAGNTLASADRDGIFKLVQDLLLRSSGESAGARSPTALH
jgi:hypothetical protein